MDESYFGGARKGQRDRGARGKSIILASWSATAGSIQGSGVVLGGGGS